MNDAMASAAWRVLTGDGSKGIGRNFVAEEDNLENVMK